MSKMSSLPKHATPIRFDNILNHPTDGPTIRYNLLGHSISFTDKDVNEWELRASRRALANIKSVLPRSAILSLIASQCEAGNAYFKHLLDQSHNNWRECTTDMHISGVKVGDIFATRRRWLEDGVGYEQKMLKLHPEHYATPSSPGEEGVVEVIGEHMVRLRIVVTDDVPTFVTDFGSSEFPIKKPTIAKLQDGTVASYILHEFRDTVEGCHLRLRLIFPSEAPEVMFREHAEHLAIEFRAGMWMVFNELKGIDD